MHSSRTSHLVWNWSQVWIISSFWKLTVQNSAPPTLIILYPGWALFYGLEVACFCRGASFVGSPPGDIYPEWCLCGSFIRPLHNTGGLSSTCGGIPPAPVAVNSIQEVREDPVGRLWPGLPGSDLLAPIQRLVTPRPRRRHFQGLLTPDPTFFQSSAALQWGAVLDTICLYGVLDGDLCGPILDGLWIFHTRRGGGGALCTGATAPPDFIPWGLPPGVFIDAWHRQALLQGGNVNRGK